MSSLIIWDADADVAGILSSRFYNYMWEDAEPVWQEDEDWDE